MTNENPLRDRPHHGEQSGLTIVEIVMAMGAFAALFLMAVASLVTVESVRRVTEEREAARAALEDEVARIESLGLGGVLQEMDLIAAGPGLPEAFTWTFAPVGPGLPDDATGQVLVITDETLSDEEIGFPLGLPRDLDGDGLAENDDTRETATLLPVLVRVQWSGLTGASSLQSCVLLHRPRSTQ